MDIVSLLRELNVSIAEGASATTWLLGAPDGSFFEVAPAQPEERLNAHAVRNLIAHHDAAPRALLVGRTATEGVVQRAKQGKIDILTAEPIRLIHAGVSYEAEENLAPKRPDVRSRRPAWTRWAVERYLLLAAEPARQPVIAEMLGTSQQSVSNAARYLGDLVIDHGDGLVARDRSRLLNHWRDEYIGPGGQEFGWYSLDPIAEQVTNAVDVANFLDAQPLVSGDMAADRYAPWKLPTRGRIYVSIPIDLSDDGFVPAPINEATLTVCTPRDPSLWKLLDLFSAPEGTDNSTLADAMIVYWDLAHSPELDSDAAAEHLGTFIAKVS
ncbi:hypothetical protein [Nesterenkonia muleiensis]|uniref:hypothetical protein n=1 Tax=Nesterenkonia muleiensis TaxID=2282648 RepID=UPI0013001AB6|nr:hypothetical protein [Nesterenkonia muleiensis]